MGYEHCVQNFILEKISRYALFFSIIIIALSIRACYISRFLNFLCTYIKEVDNFPSYFYKYASDCNMLISSIGIVLEMTLIC